MWDVAFCPLANIVDFNMLPSRIKWVTKLSLVLEAFIEEEEPITIELSLHALLHYLSDR